MIGPPHFWIAAVRAHRDGIGPNRDLETAHAPISSSARHSWPQPVLSARRNHFEEFEPRRARRRCGARVVGTSVVKREAQCAGACSSGMSSSSKCAHL